MRSTLTFFCLLALVGWMAATDSDEESQQSRRRHSCGGLVHEPHYPTTKRPTTTRPTTVPPTTKSTVPSTPSTVPSTPSTTASTPSTTASTPSTGASTPSTEPSTTASPNTATVPSTTVSVPPSTTTEGGYTPSPGECVCDPYPLEWPTESPDSGEEGGHHSHCILIEAFYNMSLTLTIHQQVIWEQWIVEIENTILINVDLSDEEKVVLISISLQHFFSLHVDIYSVLGYKEIADWGTCRDFIYVSISIQIEITQSVVVIGNGNSCGLVEAVRNSTPECGCSSQEQDDIESLLEEILAILGDASYSYEQQLAVCFDLFESFFQSHSVSLKVFLLKVHIHGYGSIESLLRVCHTYKLITTLSLSISGSSSVDCALLAALEEASTNSSFSPSEQVQIVQLQQKLQVFFQSTIDLKLRLEYVSSQCHQLFKLAGFIIRIIEEVHCHEWGGDIYDLIFCSGICKNHGCGNPNNGHGPQTTSSAPTTSTSTPSTASPSTPSPSTPSPSTASPSTASPSTPSPSTASPSTASPSTPSPSTASPTTPPPTTTTQTPADCNKCPDLIAVDGQNKTILTEVLLSHYNTWTLSKKSGFNSCFNSIRRAIWDHISFPTVAQKLKGCNTAFKGYSTNNVAIQDEVFNIQITVWLGTIRQFVACTN